MPIRTGIQCQDTLHTSLSADGPFHTICVSSFLNYIYFQIYSYVVRYFVLRRSNGPQILSCFTLNMSLMFVQWHVSSAWKKADVQAICKTADKNKNTMSRKKNKSSQNCTHGSADIKNMCLFKIAGRIAASTWSVFICRSILL